jgi:protein-disulfide isomerase
MGIIIAVALVAMLSVVGVTAIVLVNSDDEPGTGPNTAAGSGAADGASPSGGSSSKPAADPTTGLVLGTGSVRVDIYVDYQCPPCSTFEEATADVLTGYVTSNRVTLAIHPVAFIDHRSKNKYATRAAAAAACAHDEGKLLEFHSHLLGNQPAEDTEGPTDSDFVTAGKSLGLGSGFESCVTGQKKLTWVRQATAAAQGYGVSSVPAAYVNDQEIDTTQSALVTAVTSAR